MVDAPDEKVVPKILGLVGLSAIFSGIVAYGIHGTNNWTMTMGSFLEVAGLSWGALLVVGIGGAWLLSRLMGNRG